MAVTLEITEGPEAGRQLEIDRDLVVGRDGVDLVLEDDQVSRRHARFSVRGDAVTVEDLDSTNGTYLNGSRLEKESLFHEGDELRMGTTVFAVHGAGGVPEGASAVRAVPPGLAIHARRPDYVPLEVVDEVQTAPEPRGDKDEGATGVPELDRFVDARVKRQAQLAPLALLMLIALAVVIYVGATS